MKQALLVVLMILPLASFAPSFAQYGYTQPNQNTVPIPSQLNQMATQANQTIQTMTGGKSITDSILNAIQQFFNQVIGTANIQSNGNPIGLSSPKLQNVTNSGFKVGQDLVNTSFDINSFIFNLINTFSPVKIPFWIVVGISAIITIAVLIKIGKMALEKGAIIAGLILCGVLILMVLSIRNNIIS